MMTREMTGGARRGLSAVLCWATAMALWWREERRVIAQDRFIRFFFAFAFAQ